MTEAETQAQIDSAVARHKRPIALTAAVPAGVAAERERTRAIISMTPAGLEAVSGEAIHKGTSVEDYRSEIAAQSILASFRLMSPSAGASTVQAAEPLA